MKDYKCITKKMYKESVITSTIVYRKDKNIITEINKNTKKLKTIKFLNEETAKKEFARLTNKTKR